MRTSKGYCLPLILTLNDAYGGLVALTYDEKDAYDGGIVTAYEHTA